MLGLTIVSSTFGFSSFFTSSKIGVGITGAGLTASVGFSTLFTSGKEGVGIAGAGLTVSAGFSTLFFGM